MSDGLRLFGAPLPPLDAPSKLPDWRQADPVWIEAALARAQARPGGGWTVIGAHGDFDATPRRLRIDGRDWVVWRDATGLRVAPEACPHMGASMASCRVEGDQLVCPWHGLRLGPSGHGEWRHHPTFDDGHLLWARLLDEAALDEPPRAERPARGIDAVISREGVCEASDIIANRLDPWHGAHYHPYSFARLRVVEQLESEITVRVVYRIVGNVGVEVDARFHCPSPRSIVMTIVRGSGSGSVVETHATPVDPGRSRVFELTIASSDHPRFWSVARLLRPVCRPLIRRVAHRLWVDDLAYAERRYELRAAQSRSGSIIP